MLIKISSEGTITSVRYAPTPKFNFPGFGSLLYATVTYLSIKMLVKEVHTNLDSGPNLKQMINTSEFHDIECYVQSYHHQNEMANVGS